MPKAIALWKTPKGTIIPEPVTTSPVKTRTGMIKECYPKYNADGLSALCYASSAEQARSIVARREAAGMPGWDDPSQAPGEEA